MSCSNCVHNEKNEYREEKFSSFLGGIFLTRKTISNFDFFNLLEKFQYKYSVYIIDEDLNIMLDISNNTISLIDDYDTPVVYNNKKMTVRDYLYTITSSNVREFFGLDSDINQILNCGSLSMRKLLKKNT